MVAKKNCPVLTCANLKKIGFYGTECAGAVPMLLTLGYMECGGRVLLARRTRRRFG